MRRVRLVGAQAQLLPTRRHYAALTNCTHRSRSLRPSIATTRTSSSRSRLVDQALAHTPSGLLNANAGWPVIAAIADNLHCWTEPIGLPHTIALRAHTNRRRMLTMPGRLTRHSRITTLHLPARWPWHTDWPRCAGQTPRATSAHLRHAIRPTRPRPEHNTDRPAPGVVVERRGRLIGDVESINRTLAGGFCDRREDLRRPGTTGRRTLSPLWNAECLHRCRQRSRWELAQPGRRGP